MKIISHRFMSKLANLAVFFIIISFVLTPLAPVFAQEATPSSTPTETETISEPQAIEVEIPTPVIEEETSPIIEEKPPIEEIKPEEEKPPEEESMMMMSSPEPEGQVLGKYVAPQISATDGSLKYAYPIVVPPGRNGLNPNLSINYSSNNRSKDSVIAMGWSFNIPYIQRVNKKGTDKLYTDDYFMSSIDGELIDQGSGVFTPRIENGTFNKYVYASNVWTVTDKNGTEYVFGGTAQARQDNPGDSSKIFSWMLEEVTDMNDNTISYTYYKDQGQIYPDNISYNQSGLFSIVFNRASRTIAVETYAPAFQAKSSYYINQVEVVVDGDTTATYDIGVANDLVEDITITGYDENAVSAALPPVTMSYSVSGDDFDRDAGFKQPTFMNGGTETNSQINSATTVMVDVNGDSLTDLIRTNSSAYNSGDTTYGVWLNTGTGFTRSSTFKQPTYMDGATEMNSQLNSTAIVMIDVNGDGLTDLMRSNSSTYDSGDVKYGVWINNGTTGFTRSGTWKQLTYMNGGTETNSQLNTAAILPVDVNGDGLTDFIRSNSSAYNSGDTTYGVWLNTGTGFSRSSTWKQPTYMNGATETNSQLNSATTIMADVNGDSLADLVRTNSSAYNSGDTTLGVWLNTGTGFTRSSTFKHPTYMDGATEMNSQLSTTAILMTDVNGDGLTDLIRSNSSAYNSSDVKYGIWINTGTGFTRSSTWKQPTYMDGATEMNSQLSSTAILTVDVNGDGLTDFIRSNSSAYDSGDVKYGVWINSGTLHSEIAGIENSMGSTTEVEYVNPAIQDSSNVAPIRMYAVASLTTDDNNGNTGVVAYEYLDADYYYNDPFDRRFAGFGQVIETDEDGNVTTTKYHQGNNENGNEPTDSYTKIGKEYEKTVENNSSDLYLLTRKNYVEDSLGGDSNSVQVESELSMQYDGTGSHTDKAVEYEYDAYGNKTKETQYGKVTGAVDGTFSDTGSDKSTEDILYVANTTDYVVGLPYQNTVIDQSSVKVRESKTYYDTQSLGTVTDGNPTKVEQWKVSSTYINNQKTYNANGTVATSTDPRGKVTTYSYDAFNMYPATVTDPLSQTLEYTYDYSLGKPKQVTDQNDFVYQTVYDGLDRVLEEKIPGFGSPYTPVTKTAYVYTDTSGAVKVQKTDNLDGSVSRVVHQYFDGLGRLIQERKEAESDFNVKDVIYNDRGMLLKESIPYTSSGSSKTSATGTSTLYTNYTYDPLKRPLTEVSPLGTTSYVYDGWKTSITDAESNVKHYTKDARENLIKVEEVNGASTYTTNYEYDLNNKLTKITDALSNIRNFTYDGLGRRLTAEDLHASGDGTYGTWSFTYDDAGNMTQAVSPRSLTTNYTYNDINQQLTEDYTGAGGTEITYTYGGGCTNGTEKLCSVSMASGANTSYTYDSNGNIVSEAKTINGTAYTTSYTYDRQGNKLVITYPDSAEVRYTYNTAGLLNQIERKESGGSYTDVVSNFDYSPVDKVTTQADVNGVTTTNTYDATKMYRMTRKLTQNTVPTKHQDLNYTYDNVNNITQIVDASNTNSSKTANYVYDDLNRMTSATITSVAGGQSTYTHTYTYDALGNITSGPIGSYTYAGTNYANPHAATTINSVTYTYDNDGNLTGNGTLSNTWNYKDQLTQAVAGGVTSNYLYDHAGERASLANGTTTTVYPNDYYNTDSTKKTKSIYAGDQLVATIETVSGTVTPYYTHTDQLGSITATSDGSAALVETLDYFPYGNQRISSGAHTEQRQYVGQMYDTDTGLDYLNARYYKADIGRFISQDPIFLFTGSQDFNKKWDTNWRNLDKNKDQTLVEYLSNPQNLNSYSYGLNNPITLNDPTGLFAIKLGFTTNIGLGGEVGNSWDIGFASDGTFGISTSLHGGGLAGADASIGISAGYSNAKTWNDTLGTENYVSVGGKVLLGGDVTTNFLDGKYSGTEVGVGIGARLGPTPIPITFSGGANKTIPVFQGSLSGIINGMKNAVNSTTSAVNHGVTNLINKLTK